MSHKFKIGEPVRLKNRAVSSSREATGDVAARGPRYRIRNEEVADEERIVVERDLRKELMNTRP